MNDGSLLWPSDLTPSSMIALEGTGAVGNRNTSAGVVELVRVALGDEKPETVEEAHAVNWFLAEHGKTPDNEFDRRDLKSNFKPLFEQGLEKARGIKRVTVTGSMLKIGEYNFDQKRLRLNPVPPYKLNLYKDNSPVDGVFIKIEEADLALGRLQPRDRRIQGHRGFSGGQAAEPNGVGRQARSVAAFEGRRQLHR